MRYKNTLLTAGLFLLISFSAISQDKTEKNDSKEDKASSYFDLNTGVSNGYFTPKGGGVAQSRLFNTTGIGYYDASGFNFSVSGMMTSDKGQFSLYQTAITPGFDFNKGDTWGGGLSYTRYLVKDSVSFDLSPLKNEFYGYLTYKAGSIIPTLGLNYAMGTENDVKVTQRRMVTKSTSVHDISVLASVKHVFDLGKLFTENDGFSFTPTIMSVTGTNTYGSNLLGSKIPRFTTNKRAAKLSSASAGNFTLQYISIDLSFSYEIGKVYLQPQLLFDYTVPKPESQWNIISGLTAGISF